MLTPNQIKAKIENGLPGAYVIVEDPRRDGVHIRAIVTWKGFEGKPLLEQHRLVYDTLREELKEELHALGLQTKTA